ncbi:glycosyltransferase [Acinetobacter indicus]|uniref:glycosyltransferase n=1 Tax=Acinetobacter indicus TaxID=756892 RepID=UPI000CECB0B0|nr:glycosyltransferase [Acinetobacter indicus]
MGTHSQPLVTVYIPTYNRVELLKRAVKSVQEQTYQNLEIIIVDDCSNDGTHEYLENLSKKDDRVRYFLKEKNSGACVSRNIAIEHATGQFITGLDDDDYFFINRIETFVNNWADQYSCLFSNIRVKKIEFLERTNYRFAMKSVVRQNDLLKANHIGNQVFTKTEYFKNINGFDPNMQVWQDLECWYRLLSDKPGKRINIDLYLMDMSHPHERISHKKGDKVKSAYSYFVEKHKLNNKASKDLATHMTNYLDIDLDISIYFRKFCNFISLGTFIQLLKRCLGCK